MSSVENHSESVGSENEEEAEVAALRGRIAELEQQLVELEAWSNRTLGEAQERLYWLDRWHVDLNVLMARPGAAELRAVIRALRSAYRFLRKLKRRLFTA